MSVLTSKRSLSPLDYIQKAMNLRYYTFMVVKKFPKSYYHIFINNILDLVNSIYTNCLRANSMSFDIKKADIKAAKNNLKTKFLLQAKADTKALLGEIQFCLNIVDQGNNFFKCRSEYLRKFCNWEDRAKETLDSIDKTLNIAN